MLAQIDYQKGLYAESLRAYQHATAMKTSPMLCSGLSYCLLDMALQSKPDHLAQEIERLRLAAGIPPVEASWVDFFHAGRNYQTSNAPDFYRAAACYRAAIHFLQQPEEKGLCHLETQPNSDPRRVILRWGPGVNDADWQWSEYYDRRYYSAAFYLAQCLVKLDQKEEAARWLRQIALKLGADSSLPLLNTDGWFGSGWTSGPGLGIRAAEMLQQLHLAAEVTNVPQR